jgi:hypothetical protein
MYKKSVQDVIRDLKKENLLKQAVCKIADFDDYLFDVTSEKYFEINYKKYQNHSYSIDKEPTVIQDRTDDNYKELNFILPSIIKVDAVDGDFLTGYYFHRLLFPDGKKIKVFCAGDSLITSGMQYAYNIDLYKCDKVKTNGKYINGLTRVCDINEMNTIRSINIELSENFKQKSLDLYICDVYECNIIKKFILCNGFVSKTGYSIFRLPNFINKDILVDIMFVISQFNNVKIFKTPWFKSAKIYLILSDCRNHTNQKNTNMLHLYASVLDQDADLKILEQNALHVGELERLFTIMKNVICFDKNLDVETCNQLWLKNITKK